VEKADETPKKIPLDVVTRWNSTVRMLKTRIELRLHLDAFSSYIQTTEGRANFTICSKILQITHEQWFVLESICKILEPFDKATEALSGEKVSNMVINTSDIENDQDSFSRFQGVQ
jgi:hypothetical protein